MTLRFGFEVEGFFKERGDVVLPPLSYPTDGFPGLVEARTFGGKPIREQFYMLLSEMDRLEGTDFELFEHVFTGAQKRAIRARHNEKTAYEIRNIYGKEPRLLGNRTLASFQINISDFHTTYRTNNNINIDVYKPFDFVAIIRNLDKEFKDEIRQSKRQPGFYSLKEGFRVEYRSLPNFVARQDPNKLLARISRCL